MKLGLSTLALLVMTSTVSCSPAAQQIEKQVVADVTPIGCALAEGLSAAPIVTLICDVVENGVTRTAVIQVPATSPAAMAVMNRPRRPLPAGYALSVVAPTASSAAPTPSASASTAPVAAPTPSASASTVPVAAPSASASAKASAAPKR